MHDENPKVDSPETSHYNPVVAVVADLKAVCPHCGGRMAFPREAANQVVSCPHCTGDTLLSLTKLMLVAGRKPATDHQSIVPPVPSAETDRPLSNKERKVLFASWRSSRHGQA
jgi:hypothetical protein